LLADPSFHLAFLSQLLSRIDAEKSKDAHVLLLATIAHANLLYGNLEDTKKDMDEAWKILDNMTGVDNGVNAAYYKVAADYYKVCIVFFLVSYDALISAIWL
jgi:26S proteasome regulatory subunit N9